MPTVDAADAGQMWARRTAGVLSHESAALWYGWSLKRPPERPVVTVPRNRNVPVHLRTQVSVRYADLAEHEVVGPVTAPTRTVIDSARTLPFDEALAIADSALRTRSLDPEELRRAAAGSARTGRTNATRVAEAADGRAANAFESVVRATSLEVPGLRLQPQHQIAPAITADLADATLRIAVECDSWTFHAEKSAFHRDLERYNTVALEGWLLLRFSLQHALDRADYVARELTAAVRARS